MGRKVQDAYAAKEWIGRSMSDKKVLGAYEGIGCICIGTYRNRMDRKVYIFFGSNKRQKSVYLFTYIMDWKVQDAYEGIQWSGSYTADRKVQYEWGGLGLIVQYSSPTNYLYDGLEGLGCIAKMDMDGELRMDRKVQYR